MFKILDADNSGQITYEELKVGLEKAGANLKDSEIYDLLQAVSIEWKNLNNKLIDIIAPSLWVKYKYIRYGLLCPNLFDFPSLMDGLS